MANKKVTLILVVLAVLVVTLFGCTQNNSPNNGSSCTDLNVLPDSNKVSCIVLSSGSVSDSSLCDSVSDIVWKKECLSRVYVKFESCSELKNVVDKAFCYQILGAEKKDISICDMARDNNWRGSLANVYSCYTDVAWALNDPSICEKLREKELNDYNSTRDSNICFTGTRLLEGHT